MTPLTAAVVGLGRIGQGYDYDCPDDSRVLTHAAGFACHDGYALIGGVDADAAQRERFERKFRRPAYATVTELAAGHRPAVWSIAVPTSQHAAVFEDVLRHEPVAVLCEKPIAASLADAQRMVSLADACGCALLVNYMRRFEPGVRALRQRLAAGECGAIASGAVWYGNGLLNNGSHFIDLLRFLLGEVTDVAPAGTAPAAAASDPSPSVCIRFGDVQVCLFGGAMAGVSLGEMVLVGSDGIVAYAERGHVVEIRRREADPLVTGQAIVGRSRQTIPTDLGKYQWHTADALYRHLVDGAPLASDGRSATATLAVVEAVAERMFARSA